MGPPPYRGLVDTCVRCGAELGVGRFCLNCGHPIGQPAPAPPVSTAGTTGPTPAAAAPPAVAEEPMALPVQAADPTPVPVPGPPAGAATATPSVVPTPQEPEWDPQLDLLPYEEVDELDSDDPLSERAWIGWVVGAVLLVGLVVVLLQVFGTDGDDPIATEPTTSASSAPAPEEDPETPEETAPETAEAPQGVGKRINLATGASFEVPATAPPTTDFDGNLVAYEASHMHDGNPSTTWRMAGDASGQTITITLANPGVVHRVGIINGYAKQVAGVDWYPNNRRILSVTWGFEDGTTVEQTFAERPALQLLKVPPVQTGTVTITIGSVTPPGSGLLGRDYTAISEVSIIGQRAG